MLTRPRRWLFYEVSNGRAFSISQARDKLTSLVRRVEAESPVELTSRGKTVVVLMSAADYQTFRVTIGLEEVQLVLLRKI